MPKRGIDQEAKSLLIRTIVKLKTEDESENFLNDFFSSSEVKDLARRLMAAKYLTDQKTYSEIEFLMGMSPGTVNKIHFKTKGSKIVWKLFDRKI